MKIEVTQEDIDSGLKKNGYSCPIARAIKRTIPASDPFVEDQHLDLIQPGGRKRVQLPAEAIAFIKNFDAIDRNKPEPFSFELDI
jgi:hypothetical protein